MKRAPAYTLRTDRLVVRCYEPKDAPRVHELILRNKAHLSPYMGWALREPMTFDDRVELRRAMEGLS